MTLAEISSRQKISLSYLEQLFGKLRRHELVDSVRGPGGGYRLAKETGLISVADIILAVDEPIDATQCAGKENCRENRRLRTSLGDAERAHLHYSARDVAQLVEANRCAAGREYHPRHAWRSEGKYKGRGPA